MEGDFDPFLDEVHAPKILEEQRRINTYYERFGNEKGRLTTEEGYIELIRSKDIIERSLPPAPAVIADVGGGPGVYASWLLEKGYEVHLIDPVELHIGQAKQAFDKVKQTVDGKKPPVSTATVGSANNIPLDAESVDVVLCMGPMYHLLTEHDRLAAAHEAFRTLKPGGVFLAQGISKFASLIDGLQKQFLRDPKFAGIVKQDLQSGQHRNPTQNPDYFTTGFFHHPSVLAAEVGKAGFKDVELVAVEGPFRPGKMQREDAVFKDTVMQLIRSVEREPSLLGASPHIMAIGKK